MIAYQAQAYSFAESIDFWDDLRIEARSEASLGDAAAALREDDGQVRLRLSIRGEVVDVEISRWKDLVVERYDIQHLEGEAYVDARDLLELKLMEGADFGMAGGLVAEIGSRPDEPRFHVFGGPASDTEAAATVDASHRSFATHRSLATHRQQSSLRAWTQALFGAAAPLFREVFQRRTDLHAAL